MKQVIARILILFCIFLAGVSGTALLLNGTATDDRSDFNEATFPEVMVDLDGTLQSRMYGYAQPMQADFARDSVTPLDTSKKLIFVVNPYGAEVQSFSYEIVHRMEARFWRIKRSKSWSRMVRTFGLP